MSAHYKLYYKDRLPERKEDIKGMKGGRRKERKDKKSRIIYLLTFRN